MASNEGSGSRPNEGFASRPQEQQQPSMQSPKSHDSAAKLRKEKLMSSRKSFQKSSHSENNRLPGQAYETPEGQPSAIADEDREKENALGNEPSFSLANPTTKLHAKYQSHGFYEDPEYRDYNPRYERDNNQPLWSLAVPLPRVVRPGMRLGKSKKGKGDVIATETEEVDPEAQGGQQLQEGEEQEVDEKKEAQPEATIAITIGLCSTFSRVTSQEQAGTFESQSWTWGFAFMLSIYITGGISGGHLNPAMTISLSVYRGFPSRRCVEYVFAQILGGLVAGAVAYGLYHDAIFNAASVNQETPGQILETGLYTLPKTFVHPVTAFFTEFVGSGIFVCTVLALGDHTNAPPGAGMQAFIIGILVALLCMALSYSTGGCFNPARDFGPRLVALMAGYGGHLFTDQHAWWIWGPWVADIFGGLFGAFMYDMFIFTGGESPVNYPPGRIRRALHINSLKLWDRLARNEPRKDSRDIEADVVETERQ